MKPITLDPFWEPAIHVERLAKGHFKLCTSLPGDPREPKVWGIAESHLTQAGLERFRQELKHQEGTWRVCHGAPAPAMSSAIGTIGGKHSGVAVLSNSPIRPLANDWPKQDWQTARIQSMRSFSPKPVGQTK